MAICKKNFNCVSKNTLIVASSSRVVPRTRRWAVPFIGSVVSKTPKWQGNAPGISRFLCKSSVLRFKVKGRVSTLTAPNLSSSFLPSISKLKKKQYRWTKCSCSRRDPLKDGYDHQPSPTTSSFSEGLHQHQNPPGVGGARLSRNLGARRFLET